MTEELVAIDALTAGAVRLSLDGCGELARRLVEHIVIQQQNHHHDLHPLAGRRHRFVGALRAVAETVGHAPTTTEYQAEYARRRARGDTGLPSPASIVREFDGWPKALVAAGLVPAVHPSSYQRRTAYRRRRVHRYSAERLRECLRACARDLGRIPMVRDYVAWREHALSQPRTRHTAAPDVPHHRTYYERYGSWAAALNDAALDPARQARTQTSDYSPLPGDRSGS